MAFQHGIYLALTAALIEMQKAATITLLPVLGTSEGLLTIPLLQGTKYILFLRNEPNSVKFHLLLFSDLSLQISKQ